MAYTRTLHSHQRLRYMDIAVDWECVVDVPFGSHKPTGRRTLERENPKIDTRWRVAFIFILAYYSRHLFNLLIHFLLFVLSDWHYIQYAD